ncbi:hypothetical protein A3K87_12525 [Variovorax paradoxus]|uniref:Uncharacterized protein n=1 Tax=Variovorax paradoxus TaxID=34073 RepID=A0AA91DPR4_VARPD|nr:MULTISPECIES: hypothetical protein [Variovorax]OAK64904.1 hypothetical protein A3K87_12525 [Variovorax paradoxus]
MPDNSHEPIDLAAHRERRARQQQQRAAEQAARDAASPSASASEPGPGEVPCIRCGEPIFGYVLRCPYCGVHFSGRAEDFAPREGMSRRAKALVVLVAVALLLAGLSDDIAALWWRMK